MPGIERLLPYTEEGDELSAQRWNDIIRQVTTLSSMGDNQNVMWTGVGVFRRTRKVRKERCAYYWTFLCTGGTPTSGSHVWSVTIDGDTQNVTLDFDMSDTDLESHLLTQFSGLTANDIECEGLFPDTSLTVHWKTQSLKPDWKPTSGANTLDEGARTIVFDIPGARKTD